MEDRGLGTHAVRAGGVGVVVMLALALVGSAGAYATQTTPAAKRSDRKVAPPAKQVPAADDEGKPFFDVRARQARQRIGQPVAPPVAARRAQLRLRSSLGTHGVVALDPATGTPRMLAKLDGFLTRPSDSSPRRIVLDYVRGHRGLFGLDDGDMASLDLTRSWTDAHGVTHLRWTQSYRGIPAFDNGLQASVTRSGRLVNVLGSPQRGLGVVTTSPAISASGALASVYRNVDAKTAPPRVVFRARGTAQALTRFANGDRAKLVIFGGAGGPTLAWEVSAQVSSTEDYESVVDAGTGKVLWRDNMVRFSSGAGRVWEYYPSSFVPGAGQRTTHNFPDAWATASGSLNGKFTHVYSDLNDDNKKNAGEDVPPTSTDIEGNGVWNEPFQTDWSASAAGGTPSIAWYFGNCYVEIPCTWDSGTPFSWQTNRAQNATQVYYYVSKFHDHLLNDPQIAFTPAAGNFEGADKVIAENDDGANTDPNVPGMPDGDHITNANMGTREDGVAPRMQMYLFPCAVCGGGITDTAPDANGGDEASVVYHEYTHGLSSRLITFSNGIPAVGGPQAGAMGEAWSDWYAMDFLVDQGWDTDSAAVGDMNVGFFVGGAKTIRSQPLDCPVGFAGKDTNGFFVCPNSPGNPQTGGYTYADFGRVLCSEDGSQCQPEVHADGEIWAETIWQLRQALGSDTTQALLTEGMTLSPPSPSFLDERNAILLADQTLNGGANANAIWQVFAQRGMGWFASTFGNDDTRPVANFQTPPATTGTLTGVVKDARTGKPLAKAWVEVFGHNTYLGDLVMQTNSLGRYRMENVPVGTYKYMLASKPGYDSVIASNVTVSGTRTKSFALNRDWASLGGGAKVVSFTAGANKYASFGCGVNAAVDGSESSSWVGDNDGAKTMVVKLPAKLDLTKAAIDPSDTCADGRSSVRQFRLQTSPNGTTWTNAVSYSFTAGDVSSLVPFVLGKKNVRYVRLTMFNPQRTASPYMAMAELELYGKPSPPTTKITQAPPGKTTARKAVFRFTSTPAGATFQCSLDGAPFKACTSPKTYKRLPRTKHTFRVRAKNANGVDPTPAKYTWKVVR